MLARDVLVTLLADRGQTKPAANLRAVWLFIVHRQVVHIAHIKAVGGGDLAPSQATRMSRVELFLQFRCTYRLWHLRRL